MGLGSEDDADTYSKLSFLSLPRLPPVASLAESLFIAVALGSVLPVGVP